MLSCATNEHEDVLVAVTTAGLCFAIAAATGFAGMRGAQSTQGAATTSLARRVAVLERQERLQNAFNALTITRLTNLENKRLQISDGVGGVATISPGQWGYISTGTCLGLDEVPVALSYQTDYPIWPGSVSHSITGWRLAAVVPFRGHAALVSAHPICVQWR